MVGGAVVNLAGSWSASGRDNMDGRVMVSRIDIIGQNGNTGEHYSELEKFTVCKKCGDEISEKDHGISKDYCANCRVLEGINEHSREISK